MVAKFGRVIRVSPAALTRIVRRAAAMQRKSVRFVSAAKALDDLLKRVPKRKGD